MQNDKYFKNIKRFNLDKMQTNQDLEKSKNKAGYNLEGKSSVKLCVFVVSSTGNGDMPENGEKFFRLLRR